MTKKQSYHTINASMIVGETSCHYDKHSTGKQKISAILDTACTNGKIKYQITLHPSRSEADMPLVRIKRTEYAEYPPEEAIATIETIFQMLKEYHLEKKKRKERERKCR